MTTNPKATKFRVRRATPALSDTGPAPTPVETTPPPGAAARLRAEAAAAQASPDPAQIFEPQDDGFGEGRFSSAAKVGGTTVLGPSEMTTEEEIAQIRAEGLTGRQLRLARRTAQKHGIEATSDFEAVRLLRERGEGGLARQVRDPDHGGLGSLDELDHPLGDVATHLLVPNPVEGASDADVVAGDDGVFGDDDEADIAGDVQVISGVAELGEGGAEHGRAPLGHGSLDGVGIEVALDDGCDIDSLQRVEADEGLGDVAASVEVGVGTEGEGRGGEGGERRTHLGLVGLLGIDIGEAEGAAGSSARGSLSISSADMRVPSPASTRLSP